MNLIPIDGGAIAPTTDPVAGEGSGEGSGEFASIMTGLLAGDTQIAPVIDLPVAPTEVPAEPRDSLDELGSILEFVGTPPAGVAFLRAPANSSPTVTDGEAAMFPAVEVGNGGSELESTGADDAPPSPNRPESRIPAVADLAGVAPLLSAPVTGSETRGTPQVVPSTPSRVTSTSEGSGAAAPTVLHAPPASAATPSASTHSVASVVGVGEPDGVPLPTLGDRTTPVSSSVDDSARADDAAVSGIASDDAPLDPELEPGSWMRPIDSPRPSIETVHQPITVGLARRVEEAIAALANKPDPKIVTLQLDELDGIRLTVALRSDGVQLTSTGDPRLAVDIERVLAGRGFDLSSEGRRQESRETPDEPGAARWRPQSAPRRRPTDPDAITL